MAKNETTKPAETAEVATTVSASVDGGEVAASASSAAAEEKPAAKAAKSQAKAKSPAEANVFVIAIGQMKVAGKVRSKGATVKRDELRPEEIAYFVQDGTIVPA